MTPLKQEPDEVSSGAPLLFRQCVNLREERFAEAKFAAFLASSSCGRLLKL
jgi:hypothetical protein